MKNSDTDGTNNCRDDDSDSNRSRTEACSYLVTDRARQIHGLTEDLVGQNSVDEGDEPYDA